MYPRLEVLLSLAPLIIHGFLKGVQKPELQKC